VQGLVVGPVIARIGDRRALVIGLAADAAGFLAFAFIGAGWQTYAIMPIAALSGFVGPAVNGLLSRMVGPDRQGALQGGMGSLGSIASIISPLLMTQALAAGVSQGFVGGAFLLAAALALTALVIVLWKVLDRFPTAASAIAEV